MILLLDTITGVALFNLLDEEKLFNIEDLSKEFLTLDSARKMVKLKAFYNFYNINTFDLAKLLDVPQWKGLCKFLKVNCEGEALALSDSKLGNVITKKLKIVCVHNNAVMELLRCVRSQFTELISDFDVQDFAPMSLDLSHNLKRYELKFSSDKVDTMIIQAIGLFDDLEKELNMCAIRIKEFYDFHFPELSKIIQDDLLYVKIVKLMGNRMNAAMLDFSEILADETEIELKEAALMSIGNKVSNLDLVYIRELCDYVLSLSEYRVPLFDYLKTTMNTLAPNLTALVGELVAARLISNRGSLKNLSELPGSVVQILGAEKTLVRALKRKQPTPKHGLIYHTSIVKRAAPKHKGKIARSLAAKIALAIRIDALGDGQNNTMGLEYRHKIEKRLRYLEGEDLGRHSDSEDYDMDKEIGGSVGGLDNNKSFSLVQLMSKLRLKIMTWIGR